MKTGNRKAQGEMNAGDGRLDGFMGRLRAAGRGVLLLDYDGTLAPFALRTEAVRPYPGVPEVLDAIIESARTRLIIVTGRAVKTAPPDLGTRSAPEIWGSHGRERLRPDGSYEVAGIDEFAVRALAMADEWAAEIEAAGGRCEQKPGSLAIHWRGAGLNQVARIRELLTERFHREALEDVLELHNFDGGMELRAPGLGKGDVIRTVLEETPRETPVAYLGDDLTDEDAFKALGDDGLSVLVRPTFRETAARLWIRPPAELLDFLRRWHEALKGGAR